MVADIDPVSFFETRYGIQLKRKTGDEYQGPCPWCGGDDRFHVWRDKGNYWCRPGPGHCGREGFVDELTGDRLTNEERRQLAIEARLAAVERRQREMETRLTVLEQMHQQMAVAKRYHLNITAHTEAIEYWSNEGMTLDTIDDYKLGYCPHCPTDHQNRPSYTIPVVIQGKLYNIRHRIANAEDGDKYRPHMAGLPSVLFNADYLYDAEPDRILITEGEKKSIIAAQAGFPNVGIMGKSGFNPAWAKRFERFTTVYVALDPDAIQQATTVAALFEDRGRLIVLPEKLDDLLVKHGATPNDIEWFIKRARPL